MITLRFIPRFVTPRDTSWPGVLFTRAQREAARRARQSEEREMTRGDG